MRWINSEPVDGKRNQPASSAGQIVWEGRLYTKMTVVLNGNLGSADCLKVRVGKILYKKQFPVQLLQAAVFLDGQHDQTFAVILGDDEGTF